MSKSQRIWDRLWRPQRRESLGYIKEGIGGTIAGQNPLPVLLTLVAAESRRKVLNSVQCSTKTVPGCPKRNPCRRRPYFHKIRKLKSFHGLFMGCSNTTWIDVRPNTGSSFSRCRRGARLTGWVVRFLLSTWALREVWMHSARCRPSLILCLHRWSGG